MDVAGKKRPLRARLGVDRHIPGLARAAGGGKRAHNAVAARSVGLGGVVGHGGGLVLPQVEVGLAGCDIQHLPPQAVL
jgi:hypothetical protein